ncbi:hypothetical protein [Microbacterium sp. NPDC056057]|uniref:hypothetical protein n=1 Tax=Microbacterium sp. NPDC056057 TaxID=3345699 RepID=UPI0035D8B901
MPKAKPTSHKPPGWAQPHEDAPPDLWPDISKLPTRQAVAALAGARQTRPEDYLAVVNGLRWATTGDMASAWSFLTTWVAVLAVVFAALTVLSPWVLIGVFIFFVLFTMMLSHIARVVSDHSDRKRHAEVWLAALEDAKAPARQRWRWRFRWSR